jgi:hypothetical protein
MGDRSAAAVSSQTGGRAERAVNLVTTTLPCFGPGVPDGRSLRIVRSPLVLVLVALMLILTLCASASIAGEEKSAEPPVTTAPPAAEPEDAGLNDDTTTFGTAVDKTHGALERNILEQVVRLDNFFGNVKTEHQQKAEYQLRWRNSVRLDQDGHINLGTTLRANIRLSRVNERLQLVIAGEDEPAPFSSSLPEDPGNPGFDRSSPSARSANTELRYDLVRTTSLNLFLGAGVRFVVPPEAFVRSRLQYTYKISDVSLLRCGETLFYKNFDVLGETSELDLERQLDKNTLLRWATTGTVSSEIRGMEWGTELSLIRELSARRGITFTGGVYGNTSNDGAVQNYRVLARYRQNFLRNWLFYELEPEVSWPRNADGSFPTNFAFTFRLEVVFQGKEK